MRPRRLAAVVVDHQPLLRRGLASLLRERVGIGDVIEVDGHDAALQAVRAAAPDLLVLSAAPPTARPVRETCAHLRALAPAVALVVLVAPDAAGDAAQTATIRDCLAAGASGCLCTDASETVVGDALRDALLGRVVLDPRIAHELAAAEARWSAPQRPRLTPREREVLSLLSTGCSNRRIAEQLVISETTVKGHISQLFRKLGVRSRLQVVAAARNGGLV